MNFQEEAHYVDNRQQAFTLPTPGNKIFSLATKTEYTIGERYAHGAFGQVFECVDEWENPLVAEVLNPIGLPHEMEAKAFSETLVMVAARSPNVVDIRDAIVFQGA